MPLSIITFFLSIKAFNVFGNKSNVFPLKNKENHIVSLYFRSTINEKERSGILRLWTIQPLEVLEIIKQKGEFVCNPIYSDLDFKESPSILFKLKGSNNTKFLCFVLFMVANKFNLFFGVKTESLAVIFKSIEGTRNNIPIFKPSCRSGFNEINSPCAISNFLDKL